MGKAKKLLKNPLKFFKDSSLFIKIAEILLGLRARKSNERPLAILLRFSPWKSFIDDFLPEYDTIIISNNKLERNEFIYELIRHLKYENTVFIVWGFKDKNYPHIREYAKKLNVPIYRMEDAFVRSVNLGSTKERPVSLVFDKQGMHFNSSIPSDLEDILNNHDFESDEGLLNEARRNINKLLDKKISKYNHLAKSPFSINSDLEIKTVLVIGQVEDDASIFYGCDKIIDNYDLVRIAVIENPDATVLFKPHPDVVSGNRKAKSDIKSIQAIAGVVDNISIHSAIDQADHVYTITSGAGFEALLHGKKVTTLGCPFYSGWGLTDDRQASPRRNRQLSIEELFAGAYMLYPRYVSLAGKGKISLSDAIDELDSLSEAHEKQKSIMLESA